MTRPGSKRPTTGLSGPDTVFEAGSAALRRVMSRPFSGGKTKQPNDKDREGFGESALGDVLATDPVNGAIESEIIPRLMMAHSSKAASANRDHSDPKFPQEISIQTGEFAKLPLHLEASDLLKQIESFIDQGLDFTTVCVDVLAPAARALGDMWCEDECDFVDVTMGLWRLQEVMRTLSDRTPNATFHNVIPRTVLFAPLPGDPHAFGAQMMDEVFAKAGWVSEVLVKPQRRELLDRVSKGAFDVVGLTITRSSPVSSIASLVNTIRGVSANPRLSILVGGNMVNANPDLVDEVGADGTATTARGALSLAESLVEMSGHKPLTVR